MSEFEEPEGKAPKAELKHMRLKDELRFLETIVRNLQNTIDEIEYGEQSLQPNATTDDITEKDVKNSIAGILEAAPIKIGDITARIENQVVRLKNLLF